jgi:hypothetical protein
VAARENGPTHKARALSLSPSRTLVTPYCKRIRPGRRTTRRPRFPLTVFPPCVPSRADPSGLGHAATIYSSVQGPPGVETPTICIQSSIKIRRDYKSSLYQSHARDACLQSCFYDRSKKYGNYQMHAFDFYFYEDPKIMVGRGSFHCMRANFGRHFYSTSYAQKRDDKNRAKHKFLYKVA